MKMTVELTTKEAVVQLNTLKKDELYTIAQQADIVGRSSMNKTKLAEAIVNWGLEQGLDEIEINDGVEEVETVEEVAVEVEEVSVGDLSITKDRMVVEPETEENGSNTEDKWKPLIDYLIKVFVEMSLKERRKEEEEVEDFSLSLVRRSLKGSRKLFFKPSKTEAFKEEMNKGISIYISVDKFLFAVVRDAIKAVFPQCPVDKKGNVNKSYIDQTLIEMSNRGLISKKEAYEGETLTKRYWYATAEQLNNMYVLSKEEN